MNTALRLTLAAALAVGAAAPSTAIAADGTVTLQVADESGRTSRDPIFLACPVNGWNPGAPGWQLTPTRAASASGGAVWEFTLTIPDMPADAALEFKFARGTWNSAEVTSEGNDTDNRTITIKELRASAGTGTAIVLPAIKGFADQRGTRWPNLQTPGAPAKSTVTGDVTIFEFTSSILSNSRPVRVWTPPGYNDEANKSRRYPVLYMHDGQNCFDVVGSFAGVEWQCDEAATALITSGEIEPLIIVAMDNTGGTRAEEYNPPYTRYLDKANRGDQYLKFITDEVMPRINRDYRTLTGPENTGIGGSSFGGNASLYAVMDRPDVFGRAIVESAAVFLDDKAIVKKAATIEKWPLRMFMAVGTAESARSGDAKAFADLNRELMSMLRSKGLGEERLMTQVEEGAKHFEAAWAKRFPAALRFVFGKP